MRLSERGHGTGRGRGWDSSPDLLKLGLALSLLWSLEAETETLGPTQGLQPSLALDPRLHPPCSQGCAAHTPSRAVGHTETETDKERDGGSRETKRETEAQREVGLKAGDVSHLSFPPWGPLNGPHHALHHQLFPWKIRSMPHTVLGWNPGSDDV